MARHEDGFTLLELLVVIVVIAILVAIAMGFNAGARVRAGDAAARSNIRVAVPAIEAYRADSGSYVGMTVPVLQTSYSPGIQGIEVVSVAAADYCVRSTVNGRSWFKNGPQGPITTASCG